MKNYKNDRRLYQLGITIKKLRIEKGYSSAEKFSNQHGINRSVYRRWESGYDLCISSLLYLCDIHKITPAALLEQV